jgi:anaerobic ribonucleoside-triphosphate reductase activating protein
MKVMNIIHDSIVDGEGFRSVVFFAGCPHRCQGCHNPESWKMENGKDMNKDQIVVDMISNELTHVTLSGGEPFMQATEVAELAGELKSKGKNIWCYTGYTFETLLKDPQHYRLLTQIDIIVDGKFELDKKDLSLLYKGSSNQRIIDVQKSLQEGRIILYRE